MDFQMIPQYLPIDIVRAETKMLFSEYSPPKHRIDYF